MIDAIDFKQSLINRQLPEGLALHLQALWYDGTGDWKTAHDLIDQLTDKAAAHVHAYLHRKEATSGMLTTGTIEKGSKDRKFHLTRNGRVW